MGKEEEIINYKILLHNLHNIKIVLKLFSPSLQASSFCAWFHSSSFY